MTTSKRLSDRKVEKFEKNIKRRVQCQKHPSRKELLIQWSPLCSVSSYLLSSDPTTSKRLADRKVERFDKNIKRRGAVPEASVKKGTPYPVEPVVLGFFIFVVIGSSVF